MFEFILAFDFSLLTYLIQHKCATQPKFNRSITAWLINKKTIEQFQRFYFLCPRPDSNQHILANAATWTQCEPLLGLLFRLFIWDLNP